VPPDPSHPDPQLLEAMSGGAEVPSEVVEHVAECLVCQSAVAEFEQNNRFLSKMIRSARAAEEESRRRRSDAATAALNSGQPTDILAAVPTLPGYEGLREIHRGGQGVVFRARQVATKRDVAIKMPLSGSFLSQRAKVRFEREIELVAQLQHPHIVTVYDSGLTPDGRYYIVMELIDGVTLDRFLRSVSETSTQTGRQRVTFIIKLFEKIALAVQHAHARGIVHRDLKPGNIIVDNAGDPHVVDFGLARRGEWDPETSPTIVDEFQGTPAYASPEQVGGDPRAIDVRTDVYSIGVMLYRALTGEWPYAVDGSLADQIRNIKLTPAPAPSRRVRGVSSDLDTVVLVALAKERERRYQSAGALASDLRCVLEGNPIAARPASVWYVVSKAVMRHKPVAAIIAAGVIAGAATVTSYVVSARSRAQAATEIAQAQSAAAGLAQTILGKIGSAAGASGGQRAFARRVLNESSAELDNGLAADSPRTFVALRKQLAAMFISIGEPRSAVYQLQSAAATLRAAPAGSRFSARDTEDVNRDLLAAQQAAGMFEDAKIQLEAYLAALPTQSQYHVERALYQINLARLYLNGGDPAGADTFIRACLASGPICGQDYDNCGEMCDVWARAAQQLGDVTIAAEIKARISSALPWVSSGPGIMKLTALLRCEMLTGAPTEDRVVTISLSLRDYLASEHTPSLGSPLLSELGDALGYVPKGSVDRQIQHADTLLTFVDMVVPPTPVNALTVGWPNPKIDITDQQLRTIAAGLERSRSYRSLAIFTARLLDFYAKTPGQTQQEALERTLYWNSLRGRAHAGLNEPAPAAKALGAALTAYDSLVGLSAGKEGDQQLSASKRDELTLALVTALYETNQDAAALAVSTRRMNDATGEVTLLRRISEHIKLLSRCQQPGPGYELAASLLSFPSSAKNPALVSTRSDLELAAALAAARSGRAGAALTLLTSADAGIAQTAAENPMFSRALNIRMGLIMIALGDNSAGTALLKAQLTAVGQSLPGQSEWKRLALEALAQQAFASGDVADGNRWVSMLERK
jgi:hypothetical protein